MNRNIFFEGIRPLFGKFTSEQVEGINAILAEWERMGLKDLRWLAYIIATVYHETAKTMQPIAEYGKGKGRDYGVPDPVTGHIYYGRGHTQNTWIDNYRKLTAANEEGWDFVRHPDLLLEMAPSIWATFHAMTTGLYTRKKLSDYFNDKTDDWFNARRIVNWIDKAAAIADYGKRIYKALVNAQTLGEEIGGKAQA